MQLPACLRAFTESLTIGLFCYPLSPVDLSVPTLEVPDAMNRAWHDYDVRNAKWMAAARRAREQHMRDLGITDKVAEMRKRLAAIPKR